MKNKSKTALCLRHIILKIAPTYTTMVTNGYSIQSDFTDTYFTWFCYCMLLNFNEYSVAEMSFLGRVQSSDIQ